MEPRSVETAGMSQSTMNRIMGALTFRQGVYESVENDLSFNSTAWAIVAVVAFLNQLGANAASVQGDAGFVGWIIGTVVGTILQIAGFALACTVVAWVGRTVFQASATFDEMVRTLGLAYIWNIVGVILILGAFLPFLALLATPLLCIAAILGLIASAIALKAALDLDWTKTIITAVIAWVVIFIISFVATAILGLLGFGAAAASNALGS